MKPKGFMDTLLYLCELFAVEVLGYTLSLRQTREVISHHDRDFEVSFGLYHELRRRAPQLNLCNKVCSHLQFLWKSI